MYKSGDDALGNIVEECFRAAVFDINTDVSFWRVGNKVVDLLYNIVINKN